MKKFLAVILLFSGLTSSAQKVWTLKDCIDYALKNNIQIKQNALNAELTRQRYHQSAASMFPGLNGNANYNYNYGRTIDQFTNQFVDQRTLNSSLALSSNVILFEGFSLYNTLRQSSYEHIASKYDVEKIQNDVALNVVTGYLQVLYNQELLTTAKGQLETSQKQTDRTRKLVDSGTLPRGSLLDAEAQEASEDLRVITAQNQLDLSLLNLTQLLDLPSPKDFKIEDPQFKSPQQIILDSPETIFNFAVKNQPEIKSVDYKVLSARRGLAAARGGRSPRLGFAASIGSGYSDNRTRISSVDTVLVPVVIGNQTIYSKQPEYTFEKVPFSDQINENLYKSVGFNLTVPLFNGWQVKTNIGRAKINLYNSELSAQLAKNQLNKTIQQAHADANASYKKFTATTKTLESLREAFKYTEQKLNAGLLNSIDYLNAKNNLNRAESDLLQAKYDYIFKTKVLDFYMGKPLVF